MKRLFDVLVASFLLVAMSPVMAVVAALIATKLGTPVLFRQQRPGLNGEPFEMVKFRTMSDARDANGELLPDEQRLGGLGKFLRKSSLDEFPELWNVLKGDMSLVGPRPLLMRYLDRYTPEQARRHEVRPGITGWAQVNGRNALSWEEKFEHDVWYVDNRSFSLDLKILWRTLWNVLAGSDTSADGHATMPEFTGTQDAGKKG
jgi:sugar transferase EpsL